jgi:hypothetical protein
MNLYFYFSDYRYRLRRLQEWLALKIAYLLPRTLVMWCAVRVMTHASTGRWSNQVVPELTCMDALKRWEIK